VSVQLQTIPAYFKITLVSTARVKVSETVQHGAAAALYELRDHLRKMELGQVAGEVRIERMPPDWRPPEWPT
jgi:hypothetical protein